VILAQIQSLSRCQELLTNQNGHVFLMLLQKVVNELADHSQRQILEGQGWPMEQFCHVQAVGQLGNLDDIWKVVSDRLVLGSKLDLGKSVNSVLGIWASTDSSVRSQYIALTLLGPG